ncbi:alpha/beta hydrolase [Flavobacteriaceae bacterium 14752]|uniref:alpha/beta hydrolase n=1 Tax=Mesohalobacter salilacus TaxID=2491711 RepID=UPI000F63D847|nr:esterase [Flavobacteriaceae bacterium 14752]
MNKLWLCVIVIFIPQFYSFAQKEYIEVESKILEETRELKIQLPRNYNPEDEKTYPLIFVFDGDYLFEPVAGTVDYLSYWEEIPEAFVVGINQIGHRIEDGNYDRINFTPIEKGEKFFDFIGLEILPYLNKNYNVGSFSVVVGHDYMANFMNLYLFSKNIPFDGFINLSPDFPNGLIPYIVEKMNNLDQKLWYSISSGSNDLKFLKQKSKTLYTNLSSVSNEKLKLSYKEFENTNHYTLVSYALPYSLLEIFKPYTAIDEEEYKTSLSDSSDPVKYLEDKYETIYKLYGIEKSIRISDIMKVYEIIKEKESWDHLKDLGDIAKQYHPKTLLPDYFAGMYFQKIGKPKKAIKAYEAGYTYDEVAGIKKEMLLDEIDLLKETFGY